MKRDVLLQTGVMILAWFCFAVMADTPTVRISPKMRVVEQKVDLTSIPFEKIRPFLDKTQVMPAEGLDGTPYVLTSGDSRILAGLGDEILVSGTLPIGVSHFDIYRMGESLKHIGKGPEAKETVVGYEVEYIATVSLVEKNSPSRFMVTSSDSEIMPGDHLIPAKTLFGEAALALTKPNRPVKAEIVGVNGDLTLNGGLTQIGSNQVVIIDAGNKQGVSRGNRLSIYQRREPVKDPIDPDSCPLETLPIWVGELLVFQSFQNSSLALVIKAKAPIHLHDQVKTP